MYRNLLTRSAILAATALALGACSGSPTAPVASQQPYQGGNIPRVPPAHHAPKLRTVMSAAAGRQATARLNFVHAAGTVARRAAMAR
jgi:hypothetical protein